MSSPDLTILADLAQLRQVAYRLFASLFLYPDEERLATLAEVAGALQEQRHLLPALASSGAWQRLLAGLTTPGGCPPVAEMQPEYIRLFVVSPGGVPCPPYESCYVEAGGRVTGWLLVEVEQHYAAAGLALAPSLGELPDHVAVELEFMSYLCGRAASECEAGRVGDSLQWLHLQLAFLREHLGRWFPNLARRVTGADTQGFYALVAEATQDLVEHDRALLQEMLGHA